MYVTLQLLVPWRRIDSASCLQRRPAHRSAPPSPRRLPDRKDIRPSHDVARRWPGVPGRVRLPLACSGPRRFGFTNDHADLYPVPKAHPLSAIWSRNRPQMCS